MMQRGISGCGMLSDYELKEEDYQKRLNEFTVNTL